MLSDLTSIILKNLIKYNDIEIYYAGGTVRDSLINITPSDIDMTGNLNSDEFISIFGGTYSKKFGTVFTKINNYYIEYTPLQGTLKMDSYRRDFTINSIYFDLINNKYIDFNNGINDLNNGIIKIIGKDDKNIIDDPIRILRAIRLKHKFQFQIEDTTFNYLIKNAYLLNNQSLNFRKAKELLNIVKEFNNYNLICDELYNHNIYIGDYYCFKNKINNLESLLNYYNTEYNIDLVSLYKLLFILYIIDFDFTNILNFNLVNKNNDFNIDSNKINLSLLRTLIKDLNNGKSGKLYIIINSLNNNYNEVLYTISKYFRIKTRYDLKTIIILFAIIEGKTNDIDINLLLSYIDKLNMSYIQNLIF